MPGEVVHFGFVIEGHGEVEAVPALIRRICTELCGSYAVTTARPVRITRSRIVRVGELERAIRLAQATIHAQGPVVVVLDADDDCPAVLGPELKLRALALAPPGAVSVVIPKYEFETCSWLRLIR